MKERVFPFANSKAKHFSSVAAFLKGSRNENHVCIIIYVSDILQVGYVRA